MKEIRIHTLCPEIKDCYIINEKGEIWNVNTGNKISTKVEKDGYLRVSLMKYPKGTTYRQVHRLMMMAFRPVENMEKLQVNHLDGNKLNNDFSNLEWVTPQQNIQHAWKTGLATKEHLIGEKTNFSNHSEEEAKAVVELLKTNLYTDKQIQEKLGITTRGFVDKIRRRETWRYLTNNITQPLGKIR